MTAPVRSTTANSPSSGLLSRTPSSARSPYRQQAESKPIKDAIAALVEFKRDRVGRIRISDIENRLARFVEACGQKSMAQVTPEDINAFLGRSRTRRRATTTARRSSCCGTSAARANGLPSLSTRRTYHVKQSLRKAALFSRLTKQSGSWKRQPIATFARSMP